MKILLLNYYGGGGGKFIANCLSYSHRVAFPNFHIAQNILKDNELLEQSLLATIPSKENSKQWLFYEQGCGQLFGDGLDHSKNKLGELNDLSQLGDVWLPLMSHYRVQFTNYLECFKDATVFKVLIDADPTFIDSAIKLKWPKKEHCLDIDDYQQWKNSIVRSDYDFVIDNWNPIISNNHSKIVELAKHIGINFDLSSAKNYIDKYINFHCD